MVALKRPGLILCDFVMGFSPDWLSFCGGRCTCVNPSLTSSLVSDSAREFKWSGHPLEEELRVVSHSDILQGSGGAPPSRLSVEPREERQ